MTEKAYLLNEHTEYNDNLYGKYLRDEFSETEGQRGQLRARLRDPLVRHRKL